MIINIHTFIFSFFFFFTIHIYLYISLPWTTRYLYFSARSLNGERSRAGTQKKTNNNGGRRGRGLEEGVADHSHPSPVHGSRVLLKTGHVQLVGGESWVADLNGSGGGGETRRAEPGLSYKGGRPFHRARQHAFSHSPNPTMPPARVWASHEKALAN